MVRSARSRLGHGPAGGIVAGAAVGALYYASSEVGLRWFLAGPSKIAEVWPASGVLLAGLLLAPRRWWAHVAAAVWVANFASEIVHRSSAPVAAGLATANLSEGLLAAALLVWLVAESELLVTTRGVLLLGVASALGSACSATIGAGTLVLASGGRYWEIWARWWVADVIGMVVVAAFALSWARLEAERVLRRFRSLEGSAYLAALAGVLVGLFGFEHTYAGTVVGGYLLVPLLLWAAFRSGPTVVATIGLAITALVVLRSTHDAAFFAGSGVGTATGVLGIQLVLGALLLSSLVVAGLVRQRDAAEERARAGEAERRRLAEKMLAAQKLESLGLLAGNVAHDFNNLLVGIVGNVSLTLAQLPDGDPARDGLLEVLHAAERASALTGQLLAVSGRNRFLAEPVALAEIAEEAASLIRPSLSSAVTLRLEHAPGTPAVDGDPGQLLQVVSNLALNAVEALRPDGGTVSIGIGTADVSVEELSSFFLADGLAPGRCVSLEVADDGAGMDEATAARIFDPFYSTKGEGRGLGLAALFGIVRSHRGAVSIESAPGRGTRVTLLFPASAQESTAAEPEPLDEADDAPGREGGLVLVADDDTQVRTLAARMLQHLGYTTIEACDGDEAVAVFGERQREIQLVLLDLMMPGLHGTDVLARIHEQAPDTPVLLSSGYNTEDLAGKISPQQVAGFVQKPYLLDTLRDAIRTALARTPDPV